MPLHRSRRTALTGGIARNILTLCRLTAAITVVLYLINLLPPGIRPGTTASPKYQVREVHLSGAAGSNLSAVNQRGEAVGNAWDSQNAPYRPFVWRDGKATPLPYPSDCEDAIALDINNKGAILGAALTSDGDIRGVLWENKKVTVFGIAGKYVYPRAINDAGAITGSTMEVGGRTPPTAFLWSQGKFQNIDALNEATGINAASEVIGVKMTDGDDPSLDALLWRQGKGAEVLAKPSGFKYAVALGLNNGNQVVGAVAQEDGTPVAIRWDKGKAQLLSPTPSIAYSVNDKSQAVGFAAQERTIGAYLWNGSKGIPLQDTLRRGKDWQLIVAEDINQSGQIVGAGFHNDKICGFLLTPEQ